MDLDLFYPSRINFSWWNYCPIFISLCSIDFVSIVFHCFSSSVSLLLKLQNSCVPDAEAWLILFPNIMLWFSNFNLFSVTTKGRCGTTWVSWKLRYFRTLLIKLGFDSSEESWWRGYGPKNKNVTKTLMNLRYFGNGGRSARGQKKDNCWKLLPHFVLI